MWHLLLDILIRNESLHLLFSKYINNIGREATREDTEILNSQSKLDYQEVNLSSTV